jgi:UPF0755 protein
MRFSPLQRGILITATLILIVFLLFFHTPLRFTPDTLVTIPSGTSGTSAAKMLAERGVVTSAILLRIAMMVTGGSRDIKAGDYFFDRPEGTFVIAWRLSRGDHGLSLLRVLLPEGSSAEEMGAILARYLPRVDAEEFARRAVLHEGYLFPDTYFFLPTATSGDVIAVLRATFEERVAKERVASTSDIVIMASILEEEAQTFEDKQIISGILWKRLAEGHRLQVDAPFVYILGKASHELTAEDLDLDSRYNTYKYEGLPPTPITNPGLDSLLAAGSPTTTPYWFYLSDSDGMMHYAKTFEEHLANKAKYIQ